MKATYTRPSRAGGGEEMTREAGRLSPDGFLEFQAGNVLAGMKRLGLLPEEQLEKVAASSSN